MPSEHCLSGQRFQTWIHLALGGTVEEVHLQNVAPNKLDSDHKTEAPLCRRSGNTKLDPVGTTLLLPILRNKNFVQCRFRNEKSLFLVGIRLEAQPRPQFASSLHILEDVLES